MQKSYPPVLNKHDFVRRFLNNEFGNRGPNWFTLTEYLEADYRGLVHIRNKLPGGSTFYNVPAEEVAAKWMDLGCSSATHYLAGMAPSERTLFQGELAFLPEICLTYSTVAKPMREALAEQCLVTGGLLAVMLLQHYMNPASYEWLCELVERYPGHVIEFSCYDTHWGTMPGYNTVFWEVRLY